MPYTFSRLTEREHHRPLVRRNSKRQRVDLYTGSDNDDLYDDYPHAKPSRALAIRQPSQLEKYNIWSPPTRSSNEHYHRRRYSDAEDRHERAHENEHEHTSYRYKHVHRHYAAPAASDSDDEREREHGFRWKIKATFGSKPKISHSHSHSYSRRAMEWPIDSFRREKWVGEDWNSRERMRVDEMFCDDEPRFMERTERYRRIKRTRTDEWRPLTGFKRY